MPASASPDFEPEIIYRSCPICEASCGLRAEVDRAAKKVLRIEGDTDDPRSRGYLCPKAYAMKEIYEDPDRLRRPLRKRDDGSFEEIGWEQALDLAASKLRDIREVHGNDAVGYYIGNPTGHNAGALLYTQPFVMSLGSQRSFSAGTMDQQPQNVVNQLLFGDGWMFGIPDIDRTDYFMCLGGNPLASQGSLMSAPNIKQKLNAIRERGGKVVVIDPRRTETAGIADEHVFIRPGSDAYFLFAIVNVLFAEGMTKPGRVGAFSDGFDEVRRLALPFTPEAVASATGIDPDVTRRLARELAFAERAICYSRIGLCTQEFGTLASWLAVVVDVLTGNLDEIGGLMIPRPAHGNLEAGPPTEPLSVGSYKTAARGIPEINHQVPCGLMAEEIEEASAGAHRMRALVTVAGNPVLSAPNGARLEAALPELDFMIAVDIYLNETTRHADLILPTTVQLEHENYDMLFAGTSVRNMARWSPAFFEPGPEEKHHWQVLLELAARVNGLAADQLDDLMLDGMLASLVGQPGTKTQDVTAEEAKAKLGDERGPMRLVDLMVRCGPYGDGFADDGEGLTLDALREVPHALDLGSLDRRFPDILRTPGRRIDLAPAHITADVERLSDALPERSRSDRMMLIGRRQMRNMNSWLHNLPVLAGGRNRCTLRMSVKDAERLGIRDGAEARVRSRAGEIVAEVEVGDEMMPGVVSLPHGFGHTRPGVKLSVATAKPGVNSNLLTDEVPLDVPSGTHVANGIPVEIEAIR